MIAIMETDMLYEFGVVAVPRSAQNHMLSVMLDVVDDGSCTNNNVRHPK